MKKHHFKIQHHDVRPVPTTSLHLRKPVPGVRRCGGLLVAVPGGPGRRVVSSVGLSLTVVGAPPIVSARRILPRSVRRGGGQRHRVYFHKFFIPFDLDDVRAFTLVFPLRWDGALGRLSGHLRRLQPQSRRGIAEGAAHRRRGFLLARELFLLFRRLNHSRLDGCDLLRMGLMHLRHRGRLGVLAGIVRVRRSRRAVLPRAGVGLGGRVGVGSGHQMWVVVRGGHHLLRAQHVDAVAGGSVVARHRRVHHRRSTRWVGRRHWVQARGAISVPGLFRRARISLRRRRCSILGGRCGGLFFVGFIHDDVLARGGQVDRRWIACDRGDLVPRPAARRVRPRILPLAALRAAQLGEVGGVVLVLRSGRGRRCFRRTQVPRGRTSCRRPSGTRGFHLLTRGQLRPVQLLSHVHERGGSRGAVGSGGRFVHARDER
mmetsp:Transcript_27863/g.70440  ORF Transcript_27863/g.70440 Transcript_27863/m.70440 type:complete len:430 (+) Transcript_27863:1286-2575(+)